MAPVFDSFLLLTRLYWISSSARRSSDCGMVRPRALAVLRLITSSNVVGCWTGRSAGLAHRFLTADDADSQHPSVLMPTKEYAGRIKRLRGVIRDIRSGKIRRTQHQQR